MKDTDNQSMLQHLLAELNVSQPSSAPTGNSCQGLTFVVTGDVHHYKNRNELKAYIESQGGKVTGSVSKSTNYLINNDDKKALLERIRKQRNFPFLLYLKMNS